MNTKKLVLTSFITLALAVDGPLTPDAERTVKATVNWFIIIGAATVLLTQFFLAYLLTVRQVGVGNREFASTHVSGPRL